MEHVTLSVSELSGAALDWAVAKASGEYKPVSVPAYSTDWAQGGPIIERERIAVWGDNPFWEAERGSVWCNGPTPLIAAMRCYVASKLGDKIDVPLPLVG